MQPITVTLQGVYSYQQKQTIDFTTLCSNGIFGIFGQVGSGKSAILEAITFAIYGSMDRLEYKGRAYNLMNLKSNNAYIEIQLRAGKQNHYFKCIATGRRNGQKYQDVTFKFSYYTQQSPTQEWTPCEQTDVESAIGLNYNNFKRTVIIPQGRFKEFLELGGIERRVMLKEIFHLQRFDLKIKSNTLKSKAQSVADNLAGQLGGLNHATPENLQKALTEKENQKKTVDSLNQQHQLQTKKLEAATQAHKTANKLATAQTALQQLNTKKPQIDQLAHKLKRFKDAKDQFGELITTGRQKRDDLNQAEQEAQQVQTQLAQTEQQLNDLLPKYNHLRQLFNNQSQLQQQANNIKNCLQLQQNNQTLTQLQQTLSQQQKPIDTLKQQITDTQAQYNAASQQANALKQKMMPAEEVQQITAFLATQTQWEQRLQQQQTQQQQQQTKANKCEKELQDFLANNNLAPENPEAQIANREQALELTKKQLDQQLKQNYAQVGLINAANQLQPGTPCPVCGAQHHPNPLKQNSLNQHKQQLETQQNQTEQKLKQLRQTHNELTKLLQQNTLQQSQLTQAQSQQQSIEQQLLQHQQSFAPAQKLTTEQLAQIPQKQNNLADQHEQAEAKAKQYIEQQNQQQNQLQNLEALKQQTADEINRLKATNQSLSASLTEATQWQQSTQQQLQSQLKQTQQQIDQAKQYPATEQSYNKLTNQKEAWQAQLQQLQTQANRLTTYIENLTQQWRTQLHNSQFNNKKEVLELLQQPLDIGQTKTQIEQHSNQTLALETEIKTLQQQIKPEDTLSPEALKQLEAQVATLTQNYQTAHENYGQATEKHQKLTQEITRKKALQAESEKAQTRLQNLKTIAEMLKGDKFIDYIGSKYLQNLTQVANQRFFELTGHTLRLQLNDKYEFEVLDLLNNGYTRSIGTLSGGQMFQASLSLALALSDQITSQTGQKRGFFFLDEGFGTLDKKALSTVFDTLKRLRNENRVVGVISHVEELQQEIPLYLQINRTEQTGSQIYPSYAQHKG